MAPCVTSCSRLSPTSRSRLSSRRTKLAGLTVIGVLLALAAPACSSNSPARASMTSEIRPPVPRDEFATPGGPGADETSPGPGDIENGPGGQFDDITEGLGDLGDCADLGLAYSQLVVIAFTSEDPAAEIDRVIGELEGQVPDELKDDLQVVADTFAEAGDGGILDATAAMSDPAFSAANEAITDWISTQCAGG